MFFLIGDERVKAFITHGGYNSVLEAAYSGTPIIAIPLGIDQFRNAKFGQRLGTGVALEKSEINSNNLIRALNTILRNDRYA